MSSAPVEQGGERDIRLNIWQRINAVDRILSEAPWYKDDSNDTYSSVTIDQIREEVSKAESDMGIVVHYDEIQFGHIEHNGKQLCMIKARLTYINIDDPRDCVIFDRTGVAQDSGDKGWNKCESIIYKNVYKGLYHIGDREDDPDKTSNNEADLLAVFRCEKFHEMLMDIVRKNLPEVRRLEEEARAEAAKKRREAKALAAGGFLKVNSEKPADTPEQRQAEAVGKAIGSDAEFLDAEAISEAVRARRESVNVANARSTLAQLKAKDPENEILAGYIAKHGALGKFKDSTVVDCYIDLVDAGVIQ